MRSSTLLTSALTAALAGCTGPDTTAQLVPIRTTPAGATCTVTRNGAVLGSVAPTPGSLLVDFSDKDLAVTCRKPGFLPTTGTVKASYKGIGLGQLLSGGAAAIVEDAVKSTDFRYDATGAAVTLDPQ